MCYARLYLYHLLTEKRNQFQMVIAYSNLKDSIGTLDDDLKLCIFDLFRGHLYTDYMIDSNDCKTIKVVQGETLMATFTTDENEFKHVHSASFICKDLDLVVGLIPDTTSSPIDESSTSTSDSSGEDPHGDDNNNWYLLYADTADLRPGVFTYDIDIVSEDGNALIHTTIVYEAKLIILPKSTNIYNAY